jgi:hypothetical protein
MEVFMATLAKQVTTASAPTFGGLLGGLWDQVNGTIQQAADDLKNAGLELEMEAGKEIGLAIENAKNAYKDSLDYTMDKVSKEANDFFNRLNGMVQKFQNQIDSDMADLKVEAQQIVNTLPFASKQPQLTSITPRYVVVDDVAKVSRVTFNGNFPWSATVGFEPTLSFADKQCFLFNKTTQSFTFEVSNAAFAKENKEMYAFSTGKLVVPWDDGYFWSHKTQFEYQVGLGALPQIAGKVEVEYVDKGSDRATQGKSSPPKFYDGNQWYPEHWHTEHLDIYPDPGWLIDVTKTPNLIAQHVHGDHKQGIISVTPDKITVEIGLYCKSGEDIGKVWVHVDFSQWQYQPFEHKRVETYEINWKDDELLKPQGHEVISQVTFKAYDGSTQKFAAPDNSYRSVLKINAEGDGVWKIWAEAPRMTVAKALALKEQAKQEKPKV